MYIDNSSKGILGKKGLQPSLFADIMSAPDKLFQILAGNSVEGGGILPCPKEFINCNSEVSKNNTKKIRKYVLLWSFYCH